MEEFKRVLPKRGGEYEALAGCYRELVKEAFLDMVLTGRDHEEHALKDFVEAVAHADRMCIMAGEAFR